MERGVRWSARRARETITKSLLANAKGIISVREEWVDNITVDFTTLYVGVDTIVLN
jgi:hypothetical protein